MSGYVKARFELLQRLKLELVGPNRSKEELDTKDRPTQRYLTGILWPQDSKVEQGENEDFAVQDDGEESRAGVETTMPLQQAMNPSSIGLSFVVEPSNQFIKVNVSWGEYTEAMNPKGASVWKRTPMKNTFDLDLNKDHGIQQKRPVAPGVVVEWLIRKLGQRFAVSLFLVNRRPKPEQGGKDSLCLFQPTIRVKSFEKTIRPFVARELEHDPTYKRPDDVLSDELLYKDQTVFAVGHGTAVKWMDVSADYQTARILKTTVLPYYEIPRVVPPDWKKGGSLDMKVIANAKDGKEIEGYLNPLADAYGDWIEQRRVEYRQLSGGRKEIADRHISQCENSLQRIRAGIKLIAKEPQVFTAFQFANRAMADQRTQSVWAKIARKENDWTRGPGVITAAWRPFQIGFILQSLVGIFYPDHVDRQTADLLWFPTGGGKTEAYLGLAAFVMGLRRLRGEQDGARGDAGVNVIMRYTLRLLTIQQFQRAATLICACEMIRRGDPNLWGTTPFRIGLWVGGNSSPNDFDGCVIALDKIKKKEPTKATPVQLVSCPWCGAPLTEKNYLPNKNERRLRISCSRKECEFRISKTYKEGIPALVEDEEIYRLAPTMIIGTVDKFARLPWVGETQALFGKVVSEVEGWGFVTEGENKNTKELREKISNSEQSRDKRPLLPPELIIQDELHLIGGPLGTMVGLYETAIDWLCSHGKATPKVVASTATIRRADDQVKKLFARELAIFPSPGLSAGDSFFAEEQPLSKVPGRLYVGIYAPGRSVKTALVRVYSSLLASTGKMMNYKEDVLDAYYTLVGYYNSLRELGGAVRLMEDDVNSRMKVLAARTNGQLFEYEPRKVQGEIPELTSRVDSRDIPVVLEKLERQFSSNATKQPVDVVLASNMISVGVDVSRLGLMVVTGQPKTTSEYIQATSRVGREHPGLVVTVYNWARPRDVSHYERFLSYHAALYRYVEAISVTPFSSRARDRALAAAFISMSRLKAKNLAPLQGAKKFQISSTDVKKIRKSMLDRVLKIEGVERQLEVEQQLDDCMETWEEHTEKDYLVYSGGKKYPRLMRALGTVDNGEAFAVPNSMRDVEPAIGIYLKRG